MSPVGQLKQCGPVQIISILVGFYHITTGNAPQHVCQFNKQTIINVIVKSGQFI